MPTLPLRVLIVEDQPVDAELMLLELRRADYEPDWRRVETEADFLTQLDPGLDIILADYNLPQFSALRALDLLPARAPDTPFIVVTGSISEEVAVECMKQGATDYLLKDRLIRLGQAVTRALEQKRLRFERKRAEEQIKASLKEKEVLLREIHHRVKNNLQIISSLLQLQSAYVESKHDLRIFRESQNRIKSMALIHQKLYQSQDLAKINLAEYIRSLARHLFQSFGIDSEAISLEISAQEVALGIDTAVPCGLIINELITNSLIHAFPAQKGRISIDFHRNQDNKFSLTVGDNGVGFPKTIDVRNPQSLGWQLIGALADQLGATVDITNGDPTAVTITFEELRYKERK
ncbi:MAG TPA: histidine kinase dimerization/phosphoacceptor domain -containing protein [Gemmataceae bacterium]|nr:histidine kinase dimerization/phosphoacceptor domain -containing protein [Gemmataceae bacterium]